MLLRALVAAALSFSADALADEQSPQPPREPQLSGGITVTGLVAEGGRAHPVGGASLDLVLDQPLGPGALVLNVEGNTAVLPGSVPAVFPGVDTNAGNTQLNGNNGGLQMSELKYRWDATPRFALTAGLLDVSAYMDLAPTANDEKTQFLNNSLVNNQSIAFPDYTLGLACEQDLAGTRLFALLTSSHGIGDNVHRTYGDLAELNHVGKRAFAAVGARHDFGIVSVEAGLWGNNADHPSLDGRATGRRNFGAFGILGAAWEKAAFDLRGGYANPDVDPAMAFYSASFSFDLEVVTVGMGWAVTRLAPDARSTGRGDARVAEWYLRAPTGPIETTLDVQYVENPGFDATAPASRVGGVRFRYPF